MVKHMWNNFDTVVPRMLKTAITCTSCHHHIWLTSTTNIKHLVLVQNELYTWKEIGHLFNTELSKSKCRSVSSMETSKHSMSSSLLRNEWTCVTGVYCADILVRTARCDCSLLKQGLWHHLPCLSSQRSWNLLLVSWAHCQNCGQKWTKGISDSVDDDFL